MSDNYRADPSVEHPDYRIGMFYDLEEIAYRAVSEARGFQMLKREREASELIVFAQEVIEFRQDLIGRCISDL